jgi:hypothetical protein
MRASENAYSDKARMPRAVTSKLPSPARMVLSILRLYSRGAAAHVLRQHIRDFGGRPAVASIAACRHLSVRNEQPRRTPPRMLGNSQPNVKKPAATSVLLTFVKT